MTIHDFFKNDAFAASAGVELLEAQNGYARASMTITSVHLNGGGVCQGGALFTLADLAFAAATNSHAQLTFSISSEIHIFKSCRDGVTLYAEAREVFNHRRLSHCQVRITTDDGALVATFNGTGYRKDTALPFDPLP